MPPLHDRRLPGAPWFIAKIGGARACDKLGTLQTEVSGVCLAASYHSRRISPLPGMRTQNQALAGSGSVRLAEVGGGAGKDLL